MWCRVVWYKCTDGSEGSIPPIFWIKYLLRKHMGCVIVWYEAPCRLEEVHWCFGRTSSHHLQDRRKQQATNQHMISTIFWDVTPHIDVSRELTVSISKVECMQSSEQESSIWRVLSGTWHRVVWYRLRRLKGIYCLRHKNLRYGNQAANKNHLRSDIFCDMTPYSHVQIDVSEGHAASIFIVVEYANQLTSKI